MSYIGRIFYCTSIVALGVLTIYYGDFPYMMLPPKHSWIPLLLEVACIFGAMLILAALAILLEKKPTLASLGLGIVLLLIFCFYFIPYQLFISANNTHFGDWENAAKELTLASGALVIAGCFSTADERPILKLLGKLIPLGPILFSITIISYSIDHFLYANDAESYVPSWIPYRLFCIYFTGLALLGSGIAIILKIKVRLTATLLGSMIFSWFVILHIPRVMVSPSAYMGSEIASASLALAYSGIAFVIAGTSKRSD